MIYLIRAYENYYGGLHGMDKRFVFKGTLDDAISAAIEASFEVIDSYECITDDLMEAARERLEFFGDNEDEDDKNALLEYFEEERCEDVAYEVFQVVDDIPYDELNAKVYDYFDDLVEEHCKPI